MMMQSELLLPTWPNFNFPSSALLQPAPFDQELDFSYSFASPDDSSANSYAPAMFFDLENLDDQIEICSSAMDIEEICEWLNIHDTERDEFSPCLSFDSNHDSLVYPSTDMSLILPGEDMEVDDQLRLIHLLRGYGEATANGCNELAEVIVKSINEKSSPLGSTIERVAYNLFQSRENQGEYLRQEAAKNVLEAFRVMYESLPNGRFAHFAANSAILESMPDDAETLQVVDFDIGEGIQWPSLIEALSRKRKAMRMRLTSIAREGESTSSCWEFEGTKKRLLEHSRHHGVELVVEEKSVHAYCNDHRMKRRGQEGKEWLVFNCMVGLPHMGRRQTRKSVDEFLNIAKESRAIVILGDGEPEENSWGYASHFDNLVRHYQAVFESLETNFPAYLAEARAAMESLFLAPFMCPLDWEETMKSPQTETRFEGRRMSLETLVEAKEMVSEGKNGYSVRIEGMRENEMVLQWKQTPLVKVSTWM